MYLCPRRRYDWARTARMAAFNGCFMGPLGHVYYRALDGVSAALHAVWMHSCPRLRIRPAHSLHDPACALQRVMPHASKTASAVVTKILIDQLIFAPICTSIFFAYKTAAESRFGCAAGVRSAAGGAAARALA